MKSKYFSNLRGFTTIELVISIFVLAIGVVAIFNAFSIIIILTADQADRLTATYLAQEGMEIVRNIRDANWLEYDSEGMLWTDNLGVEFGECGSSGTGCQADFKDTQLFHAHEYLSLDSNGFYSYRVGDLTRFKRKILIDSLSSYAVKVTMEVSWDEKPTIFSGSQSANNCGELNCIRVVSTLYDWFGYTAAQDE